MSVVQSQGSTPGCIGMQVGSYSTNPDVTCNAICESGPASSTEFCGTSLGVPTYCCYRPTYLWMATPNPQPLPQENNIAAYPLFSFPLSVRPRPP